MAKQHTNLMLIDLPTILAEHIDLDVTIEEDQSQARPSMNEESREDQEVTKESLTITCKQNRRLLQNQKPAEHQVDCQPTLQASKRLAWCVYEHGTSRHGISRHGRLHQDSEASQWVLTEATRPTPRSLVRLTFENG